MIEELQESPHALSVRAEISTWEPGPMPPDWAPTSDELALIREAHGEVRPWLASRQRS